MYDLQLDKAVEHVKKNNAKKVLIQLPDGIKPKAKEIADHIEKETGAKVTIWAGSAFGACDTPQGIEGMGFDLVIHFGHSKWLN